MENGKIIKCTATEFSHGLTANFIKEIIKMIRKMVLESFIGLMGQFIKDYGEMANNMERVS